MKTAVEGLQTTAAKPADIAAAIAPVSERIAALEKNVEQVVQGDTARKESAEQVVLAIELQNLKRALDSGQNFATELAAVQKVAGNRVDLTALTKLQDSGVPSLAELTKAIPLRRRQSHRCRCCTRKRRRRRPAVGRSEIGDPGTPHRSEA